MDLMDIITATVSILSLILASGTAYFLIKDRRQARYQLKETFIKDLLAWHNEVVVLLVRLGTYGVYVDRRDKQHDLCLLSAAIEQGRFLFPNIIEGDGFGAGKPLAYRGYRNLTLEFLIGAYAACNQDPIDSELCEKYRRLFTSMVYEVIGPVARLSEVSTLAQKRLSTGKTVKDYVDDN
ncbi:hypothetical protein TZ03_10260 [Pseudomonas sp. 10-1B]|uniref:hypothetical protein n=1 Tax=Pseudomonas sp. 10-1B TaxID=1546029 RepID=UPI00061E021D|nr:hypothetical protein [Pseudomonas sp. 10-1B]KIY40530.1 hypothetical protein TZ03_10260 [Pseudomonas sp. 10-1B]